MAAQDAEVPDWLIGDWSSARGCPDPGHAFRIAKHHVTKLVFGGRYPIVGIVNNGIEAAIKWSTVPGEFTEYTFRFSSERVVTVIKRHGVSRGNYNVGGQNPGQQWTTFDDNDPDDMYKCQ